MDLQRNSQFELEGLDEDESSRGNPNFLYTHYFRRNATTMMKQRRSTFC